VSTAQTKRLPAAVATLVKELRKPSESIWNWSEYPSGEVQVLLGPPPNRSPEEAFWGVSGRSFHFRKVKGCWELVGEGDWRT